MCFIPQVRKPFPSCFSCVCISHSLVVSLGFWLALNPCMWNTHQAKAAAEEQVLKEQGCLLRHEGKGCAKKLMLFARCSDQNKLVTPIVHLSCRDVVVPAIEIAWKKQKAGWGAALTWTRSYGQVNPQKEREWWGKSGIRGISSVLHLLMMNLLSRKLRSMWTNIPFSSFFPTLPWSFCKMLLSKMNLVWKDWRNLDVFLRWTLASSVTSQHNSDSSTIRRCWKMGIVKELAACMKLFRKHKLVLPVHCEQLNLFHCSEKADVIFWWVKEKSVA